MFARIGGWLARHWIGVLLTWLTILIVFSLVAPRWDDVTYDGDLAYLPPKMPSIVGQKLAEVAFPANLSKSQIVLIVARDKETLKPDDLKVADELGKRFLNLLGARRALLARQLREQSERLKNEGKEAEASRLWQDAEKTMQQAAEAFEEVIRLDDQSAVARHNLGIVKAQLGNRELADQDRHAAWKLQPDLERQRDQIVPSDAIQLPLVDVWTRHHAVFQSKLRSEDRGAQLILLQLSNEFMATDNIRVLWRVEQEVNEVRERALRAGTSGLQLGISGSAAVGGEMLRCAAESIRNTELLTIVLVFAILLIVYRAPLVVVIPLATIVVSFMVSTSFLALLTQLHQVPGFDWWNFKIFKTTRIFIVVLLFGAGTDFCLFLIARYREQLRLSGDRATALPPVMAGVGSAILGSGMTTILGLAMMFFADFGKFRNGGPAIGTCLAITLLACLTMAPALLHALGRFVFWPWERLLVPGGDKEAAVADARRTVASSSGAFDSFWRWLSRIVVLRPAAILATSLLPMAPLAIAGFFTADHVTFDLLSELEPDRPSRQGSELLKRHFPVGESGPLIVLASRDGAGFGDEDPKIEAAAMAAIFDLTRSLGAVSGVRTVRSLAEPLGDPPQRISLVRSEGRRKLFLRQHQLTKAIFLAQAPGYRGNVTRFELVLNHDPFSKEAIQTLAHVDEHLRSEAKKPHSHWFGAQFAYTGATAGIRDLRAVTGSDRQRIQLLVILVVYLVLLGVFRKPIVCLYLIATVLASYYVTIGTTELFFAWAYGPTFQGLDWKVPVFLFVLLVAVGVDYNIYLVTRVFQEQALRGPFAGLTEAVARTGGIITSCGIIMAGTFVSMVSSSLRGMVELGFALSLGVLLDTFFVRTLLVPAILALCCRWHAAFGGRAVPSNAKV